MTGLEIGAAEGAGLSFEQCYRTHRQEVYRWCLRYGAGRHAWAEDVAHDVFVRLIEHLPKLQRTGELAPWLYRVTANLALNRLRNDQSVLGRLAQWVVGDPEVVASPADQHSLREAVISTLDRLPARERIVLCMKVIDGRSQKEIAAALDMSEGYVSKLATRGWDLVQRSGWEVDSGS